MSGYRGRREFRLGPGMVLLYTLAAALIASGAVFTYRERGRTWVSVGMAIATIIGMGGIVEGLVMRIRLTDDALVVTDLRGRRSYPKSDIAGVGEARASPTAIRLADGCWVKLPSVGSSLGNSIRAWLAHA